MRILIVGGTGRRGIGPGHADAPLDQSIRFHVEIRLPPVGRIVSYCGDLGPMPRRP